MKEHNIIRRLHLQGFTRRGLRVNGEGELVEDDEGKQNHGDGDDAEHDEPALNGTPGAGLHKGVADTSLDLDEIRQLDAVGERTARAINALGDLRSEAGGKTQERKERVCRGCFEHMLRNHPEEVPLSEDGVLTGVVRHWDEFEGDKVERHRSICVYQPHERQFTADDGDEYLIE